MSKSGAHSSHLEECWSLSLCSDDMQVSTWHRPAELASAPPMSKSAAAAAAAVAAAAAASGLVPGTRLPAGSQPTLSQAGSGTLSAGVSMAPQQQQQPPVQAGHSSAYAAGQVGRATWGLPDTSCCAFAALSLPFRCHQPGRCCGALGLHGMPQYLSHFS